MTDLSLFADMGKENPLPEGLREFAGKRVRAAKPDFEAAQRTHEKTIKVFLESGSERLLRRAEELKSKGPYIQIKPDFSDPVLVRFVALLKEKYASYRIHSPDTMSTMDNDFGRLNLYLEKVSDTEFKIEDKCTFG